MPSSGISLGTVEEIVAAAILFDAQVYPALLAPKSGALLAAEEHAGAAPFSDVLRDVIPAVQAHGIRHLPPQGIPVLGILCGGQPEDLGPNRNGVSEAVAVHQGQSHLNLELVEWNTLAAVGQDVGIDQGEIHEVIQHPLVPLFGLSFDPVIGEK